MPIIHNLIADQFGSHIGKYQGRLKITQKGATLAQAPLLHLESVTISSQGVSISAAAIQACTERGIPIHFLSHSGTPYAALYSAGLTGTVLTRRAQLRAYTQATGWQLALALAQGKIENQAALLRYSAKYRKEKQPNIYQELRLLAGEILDHIQELSTLAHICVQEGHLVDDIRGPLLSIEGRAAQRYWRGLKQLLPTHLAWPGRQGRAARDPFNSALNYGYGILYSQIERALVLADLDPYGGFIHVDRPGKPSLVLDLIEPFRVPVVDRTILGLVNKGVALNQEDNGRLTPKTRHQLAQKILNRLEAQERYQGQRHTLRAIIQMQARHLATFVRQEKENYQPYIVHW